MEDEGLKLKGGEVGSHAEYWASDDESWVCTVTAQERGEGEK